MVGTRFRPYIYDAFQSLHGGNLKGLSVLDIGCGRYCPDLKIASQHGASLCVGLDLGKDLSEEVPRDVVNYIQSDICISNLPIRDGSFDIAVMDSVIEHLQDPIKTLAQVHRVLAPGGVLVLVTPNQASLKNRIKLMLGGSVYAPLSQWISTARVKKGERSEFVGHLREYTALEVDTMLEQAGFKTNHLRMYKVGMSANQSESGAVFQAYSGVSVRAGSIESLSASRFLMSLYGLAETLVPSWRYTIAITANKE